MSLEEDDGVPNVDNMHLQLNLQDAGAGSGTTAPISPADGSRTSDDHCHGEELPADNVARNQLIAVSILCFLFMIGEITGAYYDHVTMNSITPVYRPLLQSEVG